MASSEKPNKSGERPIISDKKTAAAKDDPAWADGLKQLYDDVVEEPLPDSFKDLLAQLDTADEDAPKSKGGL